MVSSSDVNVTMSKDTGGRFSERISRHNAGKRKRPRLNAACGNFFTTLRCRERYFG